jgi:hypothetical protein
MCVEIDPVALATTEAFIWPAVFLDRINKITGFRRKALERIAA